MFDDIRRDDTLDLDNLKNGTIDAKRFFDETYITQGMEQLFESVFNRYLGKSDNGLMLIKTNMGGGKTHLMLAAALLAKNPWLRKEVLGDKFETLTEEIRVVSYTGRESDIQFGIWGEIAAQLGRKEAFKNYYTPLSAPGQTAWVELLKGDPLLILLDELPPYLDYIRTREVGAGTLADITINALSNLFNAVNKAELSNVCIIVSDLRSTYESGSQILERSFKDLENEIGRTAMNIEPIRSTSDDLYQILKKKLFEKLPSEDEINEVAIAYKDAVNKSRQMGITSISADSIYTGIVNTYPFHPCIRDLFARFKENTNFMQTRGFIRLTRLMVRHLYEDKNPAAANRYLINAYDYNLNQGDMFTMIKDIKPKLTNAMSHDIASDGRAAAEEIDKQTGTALMSDTCKLILMSSLGDVPGVLLGLSDSELIGYMSEPDKDTSGVRKAIEEFRSKAWYLFSDRDGRLFFKETRNVNAELMDIINSYNLENAKQEIKRLLEKSFVPKIKDVYQNVLVFPAIDEIELTPDKITLVLFEPNTKGGGLHPDLARFFNDTTYKNRVMFLSGQRNTMDSLLNAAKELRGIKSIITRLRDEEKVPENDTQYQQAIEIQHRVEMRIHSAIKETFVTLYYPARTNEIRDHQIEMNFSENNFDPEDQIRKLLTDTVMKFLRNTTEDDFRKRIEQRIFTAQQMQWRDVLQRAATMTNWWWHHPNALNDAKNTYVRNGVWVENAGMVDKSPPAPETSVVIREQDNSGMDEKLLKVLPQNGDTIYYEIGQPPTEASSKLTKTEFRTNELVLWFMCVDSTRRHETGQPVKWTNKVKTMYRFFDKDGAKYCELKADSDQVKIKYTTDGSNPKTDGAVYIEPFEVPKAKQSSVLQAVAHNSKYDLYGEALTVMLPKQNQDEEEAFVIADDKPLTLVKRLNPGNSRDVYQLLTDLKTLDVKLSGVNFTIDDKKRSRFVDFSFDKDKTTATPDQISTVIELLREEFMSDVDSNVIMNIDRIEFPTGQKFKDWVATRKEQIMKYKDDVRQ